ncbi:MAG: alpha-glucan family phosphorylase [Chloroflexi bacterium]|nr:alpha-glucan family phosphorylase [Chloroflexota bacterium]
MNEDLGAARAPVIAYFSMEVGLESGMPTYSGGMGVLAGDTLRAAADMGVPMVGITLLHRKGYFRQKLTAEGAQSEAPEEWFPEEFLQPLPPRVVVEIEDRHVTVRAWRYMLRGASGHAVPVYFLDTALPENSPWDRTLTDTLYGGDDRYRLAQEVVLGIGGVAVLRALGYQKVSVYHMNEGHSALLTLALLHERTVGKGRPAATKADIEAVRQQCIFTTHTPVRSGHDEFSIGLANEVLGREWSDMLASLGARNHSLNMSHLALFCSRHINGVSMRHRLVAQEMFPGYSLSAITNGVHAVTWMSPPFRRLFDQQFPEWRRDNNCLRHAAGIPLENIQSAHAAAKRDLLDEVDRRTGRRLDPEKLTIGFARRATGYKRADMLFSDEERLRKIVKKAGPIQVIYSGKAHPRDEEGKSLIRRIVDASTELGEAVSVVYVEGYDMAMGKLMCSGTDLWLNTPRKPLEASGTSGMKAALNGVPSLSVLDGWWVEGHVEGVTGWAIGDSWEGQSDDAAEAQSLYGKLESAILPLYYQNPKGYAEVMRSAIALNGSFFNAQRMVRQYVLDAYHTESKI